MLDYFYNVSTPAPNGELHRYCKDERLDYLYTAKKIRKEHRNRKAAIVEERCRAPYLHEPKGLEL